MSPELFSSVNNAAVQAGSTPSELIRRAIEQYLIGQKLADASRLRLVRVAEYSQLALDTIINEQFPDFRDRIIATTDRRMKQYHGQG